jgi:phosphoglycolate phosphatase-like HAD superfamily hydrolase
MLFVGDAPSDRDAAIDADIPFVGRIRPNDRDRLSGTSGVGFVIRDLNELCAYLEKKMD